MSAGTRLRVAVTGINGKVGKHAVDALLAAGHEVVGIAYIDGRDAGQAIAKAVTEPAQ